MGRARQAGFKASKEEMHRLKAQYMRSGDDAIEMSDFLQMMETMKIEIAESGSARRGPRGHCASPCLALHRGADLYGCKSRTIQNQSGALV